MRSYDELNDHARCFKFTDRTVKQRPLALNEPRQGTSDDPPYMASSELMALNICITRLFGTILVLIFLL